MAAYVYVVPKEDWEVIEKYFRFDGNDGVVFIPEHIYQGLSDVTKKVVDEGFADNYDFGGDPDAYVDFVLSADHMFIRDIEDEFMEEADEEEEDEEE